MSCPILTIYGNPLGGGNAVLEVNSILRPQDSPLAGANNDFDDFKAANFDQASARRFVFGCLVTFKVSESEAAAVTARMEATGSAAGAGRARANGWSRCRSRMAPRVTWLLHAP